MDAISNGPRFLNLIAHPLENTPSNPLAEPLAELAFAAEYQPEELALTHGGAMWLAKRHNAPLCNLPKEAVKEWLQMAEITGEIDGPVRVEVRSDGQGGGVLNITRCYSFRLVECSSDEAEEATPQVVGDCS
ncbi:hypothetical protein [Blastopirellula marina]|uniref:Uncharacterized protein n=1 Tax=Blastopirellula marina TaxID=124 RepID=A0A2S8GQN1_9BACT|nr:hypothetical protein [Blastopirellula marina]PQO46727.1 hypothetical protein C5Y93_07790 [Blastopirellula marina]